MELKFHNEIKSVFKLIFIGNPIAWQLFNMLCEVDICSCKKYMSYCYIERIQVVASFQGFLQPLHCFNIVIKMQIKLL